MTRSGLIPIEFLNAPRIRARHADIGVRGRGAVVAAHDPAGFVLPQYRPFAGRDARHDALVRIRQDHVQPGKSFVFMVMVLS